MTALTYLLATAQLWLMWRIHRRGMAPGNPPKETGQSASS